MNFGAGLGVSLKSEVDSVFTIPSYFIGIMLPLLQLQFLVQKAFSHKRSERLTGLKIA